MQFDPVPPETRNALRRVAAIVIDGMKGGIDAKLVETVMVEAGGGTR